MTLRKTAAILGLLLALRAPLPAQTRVDAGAAAESGLSAVSGRSATSPSAPAPALLAPVLAPSAPLPTAALAPAARPESAALPAPAGALAPAAAAASNPEPRAASAVSPAAAQPASPSISFAAELRRLGAPDETVSRLVAFLAERHPGDQDRVYHGQAHSFEVAGFAARVGAEAGLPEARRALLIVAASLHDVDPERVPDTPARVSATISYLDSDPEARALISDLGGRFGFTAAQVKALILATDFSPDPAEKQAKREAFERAAREAFPDDGFGLEWGRRLAFVDQASTYLDGPEPARKRVEGLAHEIRSNLKAQGKVGGPSDAQMLAGTAQFLEVLRRSPDFAVLPADLRGRFDRVQSYFAERQVPGAWANAAAPPAARAPPASPDLSAARSYIRSIAAGIKLNEKQTDALLEEFFEENGIAPRSARAEAVRRELVPSKAAAESEAARGLSPLLRPRAAVVLKLAAERKTTPAAVEAALARRGALKILAGLNDRDFERQAEFALNRDELELAVAGYPDNDQGRLMREIASSMATPSGKSVEEIARDGVFAYVNFSGASVTSASAGRDPDVRSAQAVFYVTRRDGRWRIGGYRQNRPSGRGDAELSAALRRWLVSGGVREQDLE